MRLSQLIRYLGAALVTEGDIPVVDAAGKPITFVVVEEPDPSGGEGRYRTAERPRARTHAHPR